MSLKDRTCIVTGSSRGIGRGIAEELAREDANVVINYRANKEEGMDVVAGIEDEGGTAVAIQADVTVRAEIERMRDLVHEEFGQVDTLVNNAGITIDKTFQNMTREDWDRVIDVNLGGMFNCTKVFYDDIREAEHGRLINISSVVGQQGNYGQSNYATTKSGMFGFTRTIALELARTGSTANCVAPGFTDTPMLEKVPERVKQKILDRIPLNRFANVEDVSCIVRFLTSKDSSYMTGQVIGINGGLDW